VNLNCQLELARIATRARNAEYNPSRFPAVVLRLAEPKASALIFRTGKLIITGTKNEDDTCFAARKVAKMLKKLDFDTKFINFGIQNIVSTGDVGFPVRLEGIAQEHAPFCSYEPELFPGLIYRMQVPKVVILIFVSGKIVLTGAKARSQLVQAAELIHPVLVTFSKHQTGHAATSAAAAPTAISSSSSSSASSSASSSSASSSSSAAAVVPAVRAAARMPPRVAAAAPAVSARKGIPRVASKAATGTKRGTAARIPAEKN
jgi:transcription initiation factor TFIID TATA-box-binding protein